MKNIEINPFDPDNTPLTEIEKNEEKRYLASLGNFAHRYPIKKDFWDKMASLSIESAALYTFGIDPDAIQDELQGGYENASIDLPTKFDDRLRIIKSAVQSEKIKRVPVSGNNPVDIDNHTKILKTEFIAWCKANHYTCKPTEAKAEHPQYQPKIVSVDHTSTQKTDIPSTKERESMLKIIIGMAVGAYKYDPSKERNSATGEKSGSIFVDLEQADVRIDCDTILKYINEAKEFLPPKKT